MIWTKESKHRGKISQEYLWTNNKKLYPLEPQSRLVVEDDRLEATVAMVSTVDTDSEAVEEAAAITLLH